VTCHPILRRASLRLNVITMCVGKQDNALPVALDTPDAELAARRRVAVEPDEESFGLAGLLRLHQMTGVVIVFDALQYQNNTITCEVSIPTSSACQSSRSRPDRADSRSTNGSGRPIFPSAYAVTTDDEPAVGIAVEWHGAGRCIGAGAAGCDLPVAVWLAAFSTRFLVPRRGLGWCSPRRRLTSRLWRRTRFRSFSPRPRSYTPTNRAPAILTLPHTVLADLDGSARVRI